MMKIRQSKQPSKSMPVILLSAIFLVCNYQVTATEIEEVVVTATKRSENVQDIGMSVAAFTGDEIVEYRFDRFWDISNMSPNIDITSFLGNSRPTISIRGGEIQSFSAFDEISVGVYQDGVFLASRSGQLSQVFDLERIEVLRGPQGTLYGRNTPAGAIKYISRTPGDDFAVNGAVTLGNYNTLDIEAGVDVPLTDNLKFRVAGISKQRDGFVKNIFPSTALIASPAPVLDPNINNVAKDLEDLGYWGVRGIIVWEANDAMEWTLNVHASDDEGAYPAYFSDVGQGRGEPNTVFPTPTGGYTAPSLDGRGDFWTTEVTRTPVSTKEAFGVNLTGTYEFEHGWKFTSITGFESVDSFEDRDTDGTPFLGQIFAIADDVEQWSQEFTLSGQTGPVDWVGGAYYFSSNIKLNSTLLNGGAAGPGFYWTNDLEQDNESWAVFADLSYAVLDNVDIVAGIRYSDEEKELSGISFGSFAGPAACCFSLAPTFSFAPFVPVDLNEDSWSSTIGRAGLEWKVTEDILFYGGWSRGFRSGGFAGFIVGNTSLEPYDEEKRDQYEIGIKSTWFDGKLQFNFGAFYTDIKDYQASVTRQIAGATVTRISNAGSVENEGIEIEIDYAPIDGMLIRVGLGMVNSFFEDFLFIEDNPATPADETLRLDGLRVPAHHPVTFNSVFQYELPIKEGMLAGTLTPRFEYTWKDNQIAQELNRFGDGIEGYDLANVSLRWVSAGGDYSLTAWARNLFEKEYRYNGIFNHAAPCCGSATSFHGPPRTFGVTLNVNYR